LKDEIELAPNIATICLSAEESNFDGQRCQARYVSAVFCSMQSATDAMSNFDTDIQSMAFVLMQRLGKRRLQQ